jgi:CRISPR-associated protein Csb1
VIAVDVTTGVRPASRIDPLGIQLNAGPLYEALDGGWTLAGAEAKKAKDGKPVKLKKDGKPSEANHGNITPSLVDPKGKQNHGGVTMDHAFQVTVISLPALRRLHFPLSGAPGLPGDDRDSAAWTVLAALGLCGAVLMLEQGCDLRSRCLLVPEGPALWEGLGRDGSTTTFSLSGDEACELLKAAAEEARRMGLPWRSEGISLDPSTQLAALVRRSRELAAGSGPEEPEE